MPSKKMNINLEAKNITDLMTLIDENKEKMGDLMYNSLCKSLQNINLDIKLWEIVLYENIITLNSDQPSYMNIQEQTTKTLILREDEAGNNYSRQARVNYEKFRNGKFPTSNGRPIMFEGTYVMDYDETYHIVMGCPHCKEAIQIEDGFVDTPESVEDWNLSGDRHMKSNKFVLKNYRIMSAKPLYERGNVSREVILLQNSSCHVVQQP